MTPSTLAAALLHDTVEDTDYSLDQLRARVRRPSRDARRRRDQARQGHATATRRRPRRSARWSSRCPATSACWSSSSPTGCTTPGPGSSSPAASAERKARETLEIYAPLAHRLGMNTIKWELEDLSFATLYPKVYDEIVHLVAERAPAREEYLAVVREQVGADLRDGEDQGDGHRPAEALLLDLPEDDRARPRLRRHLRPGRRPGPGRLGPRLLRGARRAARAVEPGARAGSRTTSRCRSSTCTSRCTRR